MTTEPLTIAAFLEARIDEDEAVARAARWSFGAADVDGDAGAFLDGPGDPARVLATCKAHRAIVEYHHVECSGHPGPYLPHGDYGPGYCGRKDEDNHLLRALASIYADHKSFDPRWAL